VTARPDRRFGRNPSAGCLAAGAALLLLAACSGEDAANTGDALMLADAPAPLPPAPAAIPAPAPDLPGPAAGRWTYTASEGGTTLPPENACLLDQLSLKEAFLRQHESTLDCSPPVFRQEGASILGSYACAEPGGARRTIDVTITGNLANAYTTTVATTSGGATRTMTVIAQRTGECSGAPPPPLIPVPQEN
jgi:hypothetical protein